MYFSESETLGYFGYDAILCVLTAAMLYVLYGQMQCYSQFLLIASLPATYSVEYVLRESMAEYLTNRERETDR